MADAEYIVKEINGYGLTVQLETSLRCEMWSFEYRGLRLSLTGYKCWSRSKARYRFTERVVYDARVSSRSSAGYVAFEEVPLPEDLLLFAKTAWCKEITIGGTREW